MSGMREEGVGMKIGRMSLLAGIILAFYIGIIIYVFLEVLNADTLANFGIAMTFEIIGFLLLIYFAVGNFLLKKIKTGFFVPLVMATVIYTVILDVINIACIGTMPKVLFILLNLSLLFVYCLVSMPMYFMGRK